MQKMATLNFGSICTKRSGGIVVGSSDLLLIETLTKYFSNSKALFSTMSSSLFRSSEEIRCTSLFTLLAKFEIIIWPLELSARGKLLNRRLFTFLIIGNHPSILIQNSYRRFRCCSNKTSEFFQNSLFCNWLVESASCSIYFVLISASPLLKLSFAFFDRFLGAVFRFSRRSFQNLDSRGDQ